MKLNFTACIRSVPSNNCRWRLFIKKWLLTIRLSSAGENFIAGIFPNVVLFQSIIKNIRLGLKKPVYQEPENLTVVLGIWTEAVYPPKKGAYFQKVRLFLEVIETRGRELILYLFANDLQTNLCTQETKTSLNVSESITVYFETDRVHLFYQNIEVAI